jgi:hypothetical protein
MFAAPDTYAPERITFGIDQNDLIRNFRVVADEYNLARGIGL